MRLSMARYKTAGRCLLVSLLMGVLGCRLPKYVPYISAQRDYSCEIPWGWSIVQDASGSDYTNATLIGPMTPEFYHGAPSFSVRWYAVNAPHRLPDGSYEIYSSYKDFMRQMMKQVYNPGGFLKMDGNRDVLSISVSGWEAFYAVVYHNQPAPVGARLGVVSDDQGRRFIPERHAYVLLPMNGGFYVFVYPATQDGFEKYKPAFFHLVNTFKALKDGPAGAPISYSRPH